MRSLVLEYAVEPHEMALAEFQAKLSLETDPSDVHADLEKGETGFVVLDARSPEAYALGHVPSAINLPHRRIDASTAASLPRDKVLVTYCNGAGCNASTKAALKLTALGFKVKEMLGGLDWWKRDGYSVAVGIAPDSEGVIASHVKCGC
jgi:rhodanese-related sulfurtransferase